MKSRLLFSFLFMFIAVSLSLVFRSHISNVFATDQPAKKETNLGTYIFPGPDDMYAEFGEAAFKDTAAKYTMTCSPVITFEPHASNGDKGISYGGEETTYNKLCGDSSNEPVCVFNPLSGQIKVLAESDKLIVPLLRTVDSKGKVTTGRTKSVEGFTSSEKDAISTEDYGPITKILPLETRCKKTMVQLTAIKSLCDDDTMRGEMDPNKQTSVLEMIFLQKNKQEYTGCSLDEKVLLEKETDEDGVRYSKMLSQVQGIVGAGNEVDYCDSDAYTNPQTDSEKKLRERVNKVQPIMERAFAKAYIIVYGFNKKKDPTDITYKVVPILIPKGYGMQASNTDFPIGAQNDAYDGALRLALSPFIRQERFEEMDTAHREEEEKIRKLMDQENLKPNKAKSPNYLEVKDCNSPQSAEQKVDCLFALRVNAGIQKGEFVGPGGNDDCSFRPNQADAETAQRLYAPAKPNFLFGLFPLFERSDMTVTGNGNIKEMEVESKLRVFLLLPQEFKLIRDTEKDVFAALTPLEYQKQVEEKIAKEKELNNGFLRLDKLSLKVDGGQTLSFRTSNFDVGNPNEWTVKVKVAMRPDGNPNPFVFGGWLTRAFHWMTANATSREIDPAFEKLYKQIEPYWLRLTGKNTQTLVSCDDYKAQKTAIPTLEEVKAMACKYGDQYGVPPGVLWGIFKIEGGSVRNAVYTDPGSEMDCQINAVGAVMPMGHIVQACMPEGDNREGEFEDLNGRNVCDFEVAFEVLAERMAKYATAADFQQNGSTNWHWVAGQFWGGSYIFDAIKNNDTYCTNTPQYSPVDGCQGLNYCQCAVDLFVNKNAESCEVSLRD